MGLLRNLYLFPWGTPLFTLGLLLNRYLFLSPYFCYIGDMHQYVPEIEEDIPLPANAMEALPPLTSHQEVEMRARTIKMLADITGTVLSPTPAHAEVATELAREMMTDPHKRVEYSKYPNEVMAYLAGMVAQTNVALVDELSDLKMYVVNKLIYEVEHAKDPKARISALSKLGEVDGVDAFKKRTEMTVQVKPIEEVEKELLDTLNVLETRFLEVDSAEITPDDE